MQIIKIRNKTDADYYPYQGILDQLCNAMLFARRKSFSLKEYSKYIEDEVKFIEEKKPISIRFIKLINPMIIEPIKEHTFDNIVVLSVSDDVTSVDHYFAVRDDLEVAFIQTVGPNKIDEFTNNLNEDTCAFSHFRSYLIAAADAFKR